MRRWVPMLMDCGDMEATQAVVVVVVDSVYNYASIIYWIQKVSQMFCYMACEVSSSPKACVQAVGTAYTAKMMHYSSWLA